MTHKALDNAEMVLDAEVDFSSDPEVFGPVLRAKTSMVTTVLATQTKVDETRLRRQTLDRLPALLELVNRTQARLPTYADATDLTCSLIT